MTGEYGVATNGINDKNPELAPLLPIDQRRYPLGE
jgi:hypothetical protein